MVTADTTAAEQQEQPGLYWRRRYAQEGADYRPPNPKLRDKPSAPAPIELADDTDAKAYRHAPSNPRDKKAENAYQRLLRVCMDEPRLSAGIWMRCPEEPGETWRDREADIHPSPICLPGENLGARQFAAEWALLYGEVMAAASLDIEPRRNAELDHEDREYLKLLTGNMPSMIVSKWCNAILCGIGNRRPKRERPIRDWGDDSGSWSNMIRAFEDG